MESVRFGGNGCDVNREGYRNFHLRVSKSLEARFDMATAEAVANKDWAEDITAFSGDSTDLVWLEEVKKKFREVTQETVNKQGWAALFAPSQSVVIPLTVTIDSGVDEKATAAGMARRARRLMCM